MFFEDIAIIYDSNIFEYSQLFESLRLQHEMHDATSDLNVFEYIHTYLHNLFDKAG